jgi:hypothetical protein
MRSLYSLVPTAPTVRNGRSLWRERDASRSEFVKKKRDAVKSGVELP